MIDIVTVIKTSIDESKRRLVKILRLGKADVQTPFEVAPFGIDSSPVKDLIAIYSPTGDNGDTVIIGYINKNQIATSGETRIFSTDTDGVESFALHLKDGSAEFGGDAKNMVRFQELETAFNTLKSDFNSHIVNWNAFATPYVPGSPAVQGLPPTATTSSSSTADISGAKIDEIKTL